MNFKLALAGVLIMGGVIGVALPALDGVRLAPPGVETGAVPAQRDASTTVALAATTADSGWTDSMTLNRAADGHFYADVSVEGQSALMLVDTGASVIALTGRDAAAMGLRWDETEIKPVARGASGPVYGVATTLPHVAMGAFEAENVQALIIPEGLFVSLLGQSFLSQIGKVEMAKDTLVLSD